MKNGIKVIDFSMMDNRNFHSDDADFFVSHVDYNRNAKNGSFSGTKYKIHTAKNFIRNKEALKKLNTLIENHKPDIAHLHNIYHQLTPSIIPLLKRQGVKVVLTLHDSKLICPNHTMLNNGEICHKCEGKYFNHAVKNRCQDGSFFKSLLLSIEGHWHRWAKSYERVDLFLSPSRFLADLVSSYRIDPEKIHVLYNGININEYLPSEKVGNYCLFLGRISKEKGIRTLLKASRQLSNGMQLKIVGTGPDFEMLREQYHDVDFIGYKTGKDLKKLIREASFVVVPSEWYENCSMSVLESMAFGKPVIGSKIGGIPEQIEHNKTGLLFEMGNVDDLAEKMNLLATNNKLRVRLGHAAREKVEQKYSLGSHCDTLLKIYDKLLSAE